MPLLPSGIDIYISNELILEPTQHPAGCPEGHFWRQMPDLAINQPPFDPGTEPIMGRVSRSMACVRSSPRRTQVSPRSVLLNT